MKMPWRMDGPIAVVYEKDPRREKDCSYGRNERVERWSPFFLHKLISAGCCYNKLWLATLSTCVCTLAIENIGG